MHKIKHTRHATYQINYHIVWISKYRRKVLNKELAEATKDVLIGIAQEKEWDILAVEVQPDHIHLFVSAPPFVSPSDITKAFKGVSARKLLVRYPALAKRAKGALWSSSYYIETAGAVSAEIIKRYIEECQDY